MKRMCVANVEEEHDLTVSHSSKAVFVVTTPLSDRDAERFGLATLTKAGIEICVWDLSSFYYPEVKRIPISRPKWPDPTICSSLRAFRKLCETLTADHVVIFTSGLGPEQTWRGRSHLRLLSATPATLASISSGHLPDPIPSSARELSQPGRVRKFIALVAHPGRWPALWRRLVVALFGTSLILRRRLGIGCTIRPLDRIWAGARVSGIAPCHIGPGTVINFIHTLDYDFALRPRPGQDPDHPYIVFLDQMGPLHPDLLLLGEDFGVDVATYGAMVCRGLAHLEQDLGIEAVIAVHPRAAPGVMEPCYGGRRLIYGDTAQLVANAEVVITQASTSIGLAAVFRRPVVVMNSTKFYLESQMYANAIAQALEADVLDLDAVELPRLSPGVTEDAYQEYVEQFVKRRGTPELPFWSIVAAELQPLAPSSGEAN